MRLLLDELYSRQIAEELRARGHDVVAVTERDDLLGLADEELLRLMALERRVIVTENWSDFSRLHERAALEGRAHMGVVFTSRRQFPRSRHTIGRFVRALDALFAEYPTDDALADNYRWLASDDAQAGT